MDKHVAELRRQVELLRAGRDSKPDRRKQKGGKKESDATGKPKDKWVPSEMPCTKCLSSIQKATYTHHTTTLVSRTKSSNSCW